MSEQIMLFSSPEELGYRRKGDLIYVREHETDYLYKSGGLVNFRVTEECEAIWKISGGQVKKYLTRTFANYDRITKEVPLTEEEEKVVWF